MQLIVVEDIFKLLLKLALDTLLFFCYQIVLK